MIIDCISDLHGFKPKLSGGDLLIVAGDLTHGDTVDEHVDFCEWLDIQPYDKKIVIAGNHDNRISPESIDSLRNCTYLCDSYSEYDSVKIWGSPWTKNFIGQNSRFKAFGLYMDIQMKEKWTLIPQDIDILVTHSPPRGKLDKTERMSVGCIELERAVCRIRPKLHIFGHVHEGYGHEMRDQIQYVNASQIDQSYRNVNKPIRLKLEGRQESLKVEIQMD